MPRSAVRLFAASWRGSIRKEHPACRPPIGSAWSAPSRWRARPDGPCTSGSAGRAAAPAVVGRFATIALMPARPQLYATLDARFDRMLAEGAIDEVSALLILGLDADLPAMKAVGVRELAGYLRRETSLDQASAAAKQATRRFAKRQFTWLRHQLRADLVVDEQYSERIRPELVAFIRHQNIDQWRLSD